MSRFGYCSRNQDHDDCSNRHCAWRPYTHAERGALRERNNAKAALRWRACAYSRVGYHGRAVVPTCHPLPHYLCDCSEQCRAYARERCAA